MAAEASPPNLHTLPPELVHEIAVLATDDDPWGVPSSQDTIGSLRAVCRDLYPKTLRRFLQLHPSLMNDRLLEFTVTPEQLAILLRWTSTPYLRDQIKRLTLTKGYEHDTSPDIWEPSEEEERDRLFTERQDFESSSDAYNMLLAIFHNLRAAKNLYQVDITCAYQVALQALDDSEFGRKISMLVLDPDESQEYDGILWENIAPYTRFLIGARISAGFHDKDYPTSGALVRVQNIGLLLKKINRLTCLDISGNCSQFWVRPKSCWGCTDVWYTYFRHKSYPQLTSLNLENILIDGGLLRNFIRENGTNLHSTGFQNVSLTSGSWAKVFQSLRSAGVAHVRVGSIFQKAKPSRKELDPNIPTYSSVCSFDVVEAKDAHLALWLEAMMRNVTFVSNGRFNNSRYKEVQRLSTPGVTVHSSYFWTPVYLPISS